MDLTSSSTGCLRKVGNVGMSAEHPTLPALSHTEEGAIKEASLLSQQCGKEKVAGICLPQFCSGDAPDASAT